MQLFSREAGGFVVALGFVQNKIRIASQLPPLLGPDGNPLPLPEIPVEQYWGRTVQHRCVVRWGQGGSVDCELRVSLAGDVNMQLTFQLYRLAERRRDGRAPPPLRRAGRERAGAGVRQVWTVPRACVQLGERHRR